MNNSRRNTEDSMQRSIAAYKEIVENILTNPFYAKKLYQDDDMPWWLRELANRLAGDIPQSSIVRVIENCLNEPHISRRWNRAACSDGVPDWLKAFTEIFGKRRKFPL